MNSADLYQEHTPEFYRQRYLELKDRGQDANAVRMAQTSPENPRIIRSDLVIANETIPGGWYWSCRVARGTTLRIVNDHATPGVSALFWNANDPSERFNPADTIKVQWTSRLKRGKLLFSDMGRVLVSLTHSSGWHDALAGGSTPQSNARKYGADAPTRNTRDNFLLAAAKHGLGPRDIGPCINFFAPLGTDRSGRLVWHEEGLNAGDYVDLRAEMDVLAVLSNCQHPLSPGGDWQPQPIRAILWASPMHEAKDLGRRSTEEATRAFENTDAYLGG
ncbi:MAG TPA: urea amidolyase associated protein UAAP1 [Micropepsaceae bacterium]|nr:urea amidolyase associated protein UAAP1 [Micropepsaceae bacterium]